MAASMTVSSMTASHIAGMSMDSLSSLLVNVFVVQKEKYPLAPFLWMWWVPHTTAFTIATDKSASALRCRDIASTRAWLSMRGPSATATRYGKTVSFT